MCLCCFPPSPPPPLGCCHTGTLFTPSPPSVSTFSQHVNNVTLSLPCGPFFFSLPPEPTHTFCHSAAFCSLYSLSSLLFLGLICRKVKDTLPLFRQFFSSAFSLTYVSLASMKLPPDVLRCFFLFFPFAFIPRYNVAPQLRL